MGYGVGFSLVVRVFDVPGRMLGGSSADRGLRALRVAAVTAGEKPAGWDEAIAQLTHEINMKCNAAIFEAVAAEREACAKLADEGLGWPGDASSAARCIAANIRARGQK